MLITKILPSRDRTKYFGTRLVFIIIFSMLVSCKSVPSNNELANSANTGIDPQVTGSLGQETKIRDRQVLGSLGQVHKIKRHHKSVGDIAAPNAFHSVALSLGNSKQLQSRMDILAEADSGLLSSVCQNEQICDLPIFGQLRTAINSQANSSDLEKINAANVLINNRLEYIEDPQGPNNKDQWQTFQQTLRRGRGDCEDFAIAKYAMLRRLGISQADMYLSVLKDRSRERYHAVLIVRVDGTYHVLDIYDDTVWSDGMYGNYQPLYSITASNAWLHGRQKQGADDAGVQYAFNNTFQ